MATAKTTATTKLEAVKESKFLKEEKYTCEASGTEFTFQFPGTKAVQEMLDESKNSFGNVVDTAYNEKLMEKIIVAPQVDWDYWDENNGYVEVMHAADKFLGGLL